MLPGFDFVEFFIGIGLLVIALFLFWLVWTSGKEEWEPKKELGRRSKKSRRHRAPESFRSPDDLTNYLIDNYQTVVEAKSRQADHGKWLDHMGAWLDKLKLLTAKVDYEVIFATLYIINRVIKKYNKNHLMENKNFLQRVLILYHHEKCRIIFIPPDAEKYGNCWEICYNDEPEWCTHVPRGVVDGGALERPGKDSAKDVLYSHYSPY